MKHASNMQRKSREHAPAPIIGVRGPFQLRHIQMVLRGWYFANYSAGGDVGSGVAERPGERVSTVGLREPLLQSQKQTQCLECFQRQVHQGLISDQRCASWARYTCPEFCQSREAPDVVVDRLGSRPGLGVMRAVQFKNACNGAFRAPQKEQDSDSRILN